MKSRMDDKEVRTQGSMQYTKQPDSSHDEGGGLDPKKKKRELEGNEH